MTLEYKKENRTESTIHISIKGGVLNIDQWNIKEDITVNITDYDCGRNWEELLTKEN